MFAVSGAGTRLRIPACLECICALAKRDGQWLMGCGVGSYFKSDPGPLKCSTP
jgi:hypothetical protein